MSYLDYCVTVWRFYLNVYVTETMTTETAKRKSPGPSKQCGHCRLSALHLENVYNGPGGKSSSPLKDRFYGLTSPLHRITTFQKTSYIYTACGMGNPMPQKESFIFVLSLEFFKEFFNLEQISFHEKERQSVILRHKGIGKQAGNRLPRAKDTWGNVVAACRRYSKEVRSDRNKFSPHCRQQTPMVE